MKSATLWLLATCLPVSAQVVTVLHCFTNSPDGAYPYLGGGMALSGQVLFGTTLGGGISNQGTIFSIHTDGTDFGVLYDFIGGSDGSSPSAGLTLVDDILYGTATRGGANGSGVVFAIRTNGSGFTVLHPFSASTPSMIDRPVQLNTIVTNSEGTVPTGQLLFYQDRLYGTTCLGGSNASGTVFSLKPDGSDFQVLQGFAPNGYALRQSGPATNLDGCYSIAGLVAHDDILYGTTAAGAANGTGAIFGVRTNGSDFALLHTFSTNSSTNQDGNWPNGVILVGNVLYGTTASRGTIFR